MIGVVVWFLYKYMTPIFTEKNLNIDEKIGEKLRHKRTVLNLSLDYIAKKTGIKKDYLIAMENENFDLLPKGLYGRNFLIKYANYLKINSKEVLNKSPYKNKDKNFNNPFSKKKLTRKNFLIFPKLIRNLLIVLIILAFFSYLFFFFIKSREVPELIVFEPESDLIVNESLINISGKTDPEAQLSINGELIILENNGYFSTNITLNRGLNRIIIVSQKRYSRENRIERQILFQ